MILINKLNCLKDIDKYIITYYNIFVYGDVAQLARAFGSYPKGRGFDPLRRYQYELKKLVYD